MNFKERGKIMKKKKGILISAILFLFILSSCGKKGLEPEKVGPLFVDHFIYQKDSKDFKENFVEGDFLSKQLTLMTATFEDTFSDVFDSVVTNLTEEEKQKLSEDLMKQVRTKSEYHTTVKEIDKKTIEVTYQIKGFDYSDLVEKTLESVFKELMKETNYSENEAKQGLLAAFEEALENSHSVQEEVEVSLLFTKNKKQWELAENQDDKLENILLAFISGAHDKESYTNEMNEMLERAIKKASE